MIPQTENVAHDERESDSARISHLEQGMIAVERRLREMEDKLFLADILDSASRDSGIPTGHTDAYHGAALLDEIRHQIISVSRDSNDCRDVFVTNLTTRSTEVRRNIIPFNVRRRRPIYDGIRFVYFTEAGYNSDRSGEHLLHGRRFGRLNLESFSFEELAPIPEDPFKMFAPVFYGCFHHGVVYMADGDCQLCGYNVERNTWRRYGIILPSDGQWKQGSLLSDPTDEHRLYLLAVTGLYRIDFETLTCTLLSPTPVPIYTYDAALVRLRPDSEFFAVIVSGSKGWYMYSSKTNKLKALDSWKPSGTHYTRNFLVYDNASKTFYYHIHGQSTWQIVQLC